MLQQTQTTWPLFFHSGKEGLYFQTKENSPYASRQ